MKKCIIWGTGDCFSKYINVIKYHEACNKLKIVAITSQSLPFTNYLGYIFIQPKDIRFQVFDYIIIAAQNPALSRIKEDAISMGISPKKVLHINAFLLPDFDFEKYTTVMDSKPSIFADNCWGGITYNKIGMEFTSPFINLYVKNDFYIRFLENPHKYIESSISFKEMKYAPLVDKYYPLCLCEDIELRFNHYESFEEAKECWDRRRERVNWDNVLYVMSTEDKKIAERFCNLPYENKICFVPFESSEKCLYYVDFYKYYKGPFWQAVIDMAKGLIYSYSVLDLINGERVYLSSRFDNGGNV